MVKKDTIIVITGAAGFIGSCLASFLNQQGYEKLILVDEFTHPEKLSNVDHLRFKEKIERNDFFAWVNKQHPSIGFVFHIGARTDTTEFDYAIHQKLNVEYSQNIWQYCATNQVPMVYASSAATYGNGEKGYNDEHAIVNELEPLNPYGVSKNEFDKWALQQQVAPPFWAGLKFFNVYGPNEYHKGRMASVIFHSFNQVMSTGKVKLFRSYRSDFKDGEQLRDFVYVKDVLKVCYWMMEKHPPSGLYNLGTGRARTFKDLVHATYAGLDKSPIIEYIAMPEDIRDKYQYFTEANMKKLVDAGYSEKFYTLEEGVKDYVKNYLRNKVYY